MQVRVLRDFYLHAGKIVTIGEIVHVDDATGRELQHARKAAPLDSADAIPGPGDAWKGHDARNGELAALGALALAKLNASSSGQGGAYAGATAGPRRPFGA